MSRGAAVSRARAAGLRSLLAAVLWVVLGIGGADEARGQARWWERPPAGAGADAGVPRAEGATGGEAAGEDAGGEAAGEDAGGAAAGEDAGGGPAAGEHRAAIDGAGEDGAVGSGAFVPELRPAWRWRQVLASPRIGGRLTAVTVDPRNPARIFVGTEENTVLRSLDGGVTWRELELSPFVIQRRITNVPVPGLPRLGEQPVPGLIVALSPPNRGVPRTIPIVQSLAGQPYGFSGTFDASGALLETERAGALPDYAYSYTPIGASSHPTLLFDTVRRRHAFAVRRIALCPNAEFPIMVATQTELLGSYDDGLTFVRLLRLPGRIDVEWVECSERDGRHVLVTTSFGLFRSTDGGVSWDQDLSGWPGQRAKAVTFGAVNDAGHETVFVGVGHILFAGDPESDTGLEYVYPDYNNTSTAPWEQLNWIVRDGREVWLATNDGLRLSRDEGRNWETVARTLLSRQVIDQVLVGSNELGGRRVAILIRECTEPRAPCRRSRVLASDDGGAHWFPFFDAATRRSPTMVDAAPAVQGAPPRWWVVTGGELWTTQPAQALSGTGPDAQARGWARERLRATPPMGRVVREILAATELDEDDIAGALSTIRHRNLVPTVYAELTVDRVDYSREETSRGIRIWEQSERHDRTDVELFVWAQWWLQDVPVAWEELYPARDALYDLRTDVTFVAEDAWHERMLHLRALAGGMDDPLQIETLKARIEALEAVLETWLRRPLSSLAEG